MTLTFQVLGFEIGRIELDIERDDREVSAVDEGAKAVSRWFFKRMVR